jgi:hypothetical protein
MGELDVSVGQGIIRYRKLLESNDWNILWSVWPGVVLL